MFVGGVTIRGGEATIVWGGYQTAAVIRAWTVTRTPLERPPIVWALRAQLARADAFKLRQQPLAFTAPRKGGAYYWPVLGAVTVNGLELAAQLGPPEA